MCQWFCCCLGFCGNKEKQKKEIKSTKILSDKSMKPLLKRDDKKPDDKTSSKKVVTEMNTKVETKIDNKVLNTRRGEEAAKQMTETTPPKETTSYYPNDRKRDKESPDLSAYMAKTAVKNTELIKNHRIPKFGTTDKLMADLGYKFGQQLGKGGFGLVHKVVKTETNEEMACKQIQIKTEKLEKMERSLMYEIYVLKRAKHKYIIGLFDHFLVNNDNQRIAYLFLELADRTLQEEIRYVVFSRDNARRYFAQMATGLAFLHRLKIAHKDLKPENVLIVIDPNTGLKNIRISDFGLSQMVYREEKGYIKSGHFAGTRDYMAPEIIRQEINKDEPSARSLGYDSFISDMWALGVCLFEMLTKHTPYDTAKLDTILDNQMSNTWKDSINRQVRQSADREAINLLTKLLRPDVSRRLDPFGVLSHPWIIADIDWSLTKEQINK